MLARADQADATIARLSERIEEVIAPFAEQVALLDTIPGVDRRTVEVIVAEIGADMGRFESAARLASWAGMCPGNNESAGKAPRGQDPQGLQVAAQGAGGGRPRRRPLQGHLSGIALPPDPRPSRALQAAVAVGHSILVISYHLLDRGERYSDLGADYFIERQSKESYKQRLVRQLERMGIASPSNHSPPPPRNPAACRYPSPTLGRTAAPAAGHFHPQRVQRARTKGQTSDRRPRTNTPTVATRPATAIPAEMTDPPR
jgi:hypothetical protein